MQIGFSQPIELSWMEAAANAACANLPRGEIRSRLDELLAPKIAAESSSKRSSRNKRVSILMKIWVEPRKELTGFRDYALGLWRNADHAQRVLIHYTVTIVAYPFFWSVAVHIGRLLRLQDHFSILQLKRRCQEEFGQRDTVAYALTRVVRTLADWGLVNRSRKVGNYTLCPSITNMPPTCEHLLIEACLRALNEHDNLIENITTNPGLFPWQFGHISLPEIAASSRFSIRSSDFGGIRIALLDSEVSTRLNPIR